MQKHCFNIAPLFPHPSSLCYIFICYVYVSKQYNVIVLHNYVYFLKLRGKQLRKERRNNRFTNYFIYINLYIYNFQYFSFLPVESSYYFLAPIYLHFFLLICAINVIYGFICYMPNTSILLFYITVFQIRKYVYAAFNNYLYNYLYQ